MLFRSCLVTVDQDICVPRLPSYRMLKKTEGRSIRTLCFEDLGKKDLSRFGVVGSPTSVERIFAPEVMASNVYVEGTPGEKASQVMAMLQERKYI